MVFKPSCVGSVTEHWYGVRNTSRLPLHFEWKLHNQDNNLVVSPLAGLILPNDTQVRSIISQSVVNKLYQNVPFSFYSFGYV